MTLDQRTQRPRRALAAGLLAVLALAPAASAQEEPAGVFPCANGFEFNAAVGQPIEFLCGWGAVGGPGKIVTFLNAHQATLAVEDEQGQPVLTIGPAEFATLWGDPEEGPSGFDDVTCGGPTGRIVAWSYLLDGGLPAGTYTIFLNESFRNPVSDGFHTCRLEDGTRLAPPPNLTRGSIDAVSTLIVGD